MLKQFLVRDLVEPLIKQILVRDLVAPLKKGGLTDSSDINAR